MRHLRALLIAAAALLPLPSLAAPGDSISATIVHFFKAAGGTDPKDFASLFTDPAAITDTFAPFIWQGQGAAAHYFADLQTAIKTAGMTEVELTPQPPKTPIEASNGNAYASIPVTLTFKQNGEDKSQSGMFVLGLHETDAGWEVASATWLYK
jgi:ketosteroid isomerase-like protein